MYSSCGCKWPKRIRLACQPSRAEPDSARPYDAGDGRVRVSARTAPTTCIRACACHRGDGEGAYRGGCPDSERTNRTDHRQRRSISNRVGCRGTWAPSTHLETGTLLTETQGNRCEGFC